MDVTPISPTPSRLPLDVWYKPLSSIYREYRCAESVHLMIVLMTRSTILVQIVLLQMLICFSRWSHSVFSNLTSIIIIHTNTPSQWRPVS